MSPLGKSKTIDTNKNPDIEGDDVDPLEDGEDVGLVETMRTIKDWLPKLYPKGLQKTK